jgi:hypothetical protein
LQESKQGQVMIRHRQGDFDLVHDTWEHAGQWWPSN